MNSTESTSRPAKLLRGERRGFGVELVLGVSGTLFFDPTDTSLTFKASAAPLDSRLLVAPLLVEICIWLLIGDSALIMFSLLKQALMPCLVVVAASRRVVVAA